jgi:hypothetical protein
MATSRKSQPSKPALTVVDGSAQAQQPNRDERPAGAAGITPDADDIEGLWEDDGLSDPLASDHVHNVPIDPPKDFFRTHPDRKYRRRTWVYVHKSENSVRKQYFIAEKPMRDKIPEARPCTLVTVVDRAGLPRIWPLMFPRPGEGDNDAWVSCRDIAREGITKWVRLTWMGKVFTSRVADDGYAPEPDWKRLSPFNELIRTAFGPDGIIRNEKNGAYKSMFGKVDRPDELDADELDDEDEAGDGPEDAIR